MWSDPFPSAPSQATGNRAKPVLFARENTRGTNCRRSAVLSFSLRLIASIPNIARARDHVHPFGTKRIPTPQKLAVEHGERGASNTARRAHAEGSSSPNSCWAIVIWSK